MTKAKTSKTQTTAATTAVKKSFTRKELYAMKVGTWIGLLLPNGKSRLEKEVTVLTVGRITPNYVRYWQPGVAGVLTCWNIDKIVREFGQVEVPNEAKAVVPAVPVKVVSAKAAVKKATPVKKVESIKPVAQGENLLTTAPVWPFTGATLDNAPGAITKKAISKKKKGEKIKKALKKSKVKKELKSKKDFAKTATKNAAKKGK